MGSGATTRLFPPDEPLEEVARGGLDRLRLAVVNRYFFSFYQESPQSMPQKNPSSKKSMTKTEILNAISEDTDLNRKDVNAVFTSLSSQISKSLGKRGAGTFTIPGLVKIEKKKVPARKARKGVPNPFKPGELMDVAAKPATTKVKLRALKGLKDMV